MPTLELLLSHKHPDDRQRTIAILSGVFRTEGPVCIYHRIVDAPGRIRQVLMAGEGHLDSSGNVTVVDGVMIDLTATLHQETKGTTRHAITGATPTRSVIEQVRGILMGRLLFGSDAAFKLLISGSNHTNIKLAVLAADLVHRADSGQGSEAADAFIHILQSCDQASARHAPTTLAGVG